MNWERIYNQIINRAKNRILEGYSESHHILPRSLGGSDDSDNLVNLTAREHFLCHMILCRITTGIQKHKMIWALHRMTYSGEYHLSSRQYEYVRTVHAHTVTINHPSYRDKTWGERVSTANKKSWANDEDRRHATSERMKQLWSERREELTEHNRRVSKLGASAAATALKGKPRPECAMKGSLNPMAKTYTIQTPDGEQIIVDDLKKFCYDNGLSYACMSQVSRGKNRQHKGYKIINKFGKR